VLFISNNKALPLCLSHDKHAGQVQDGKCPPTQLSALSETKGSLNLSMLSHPHRGREEEAFLIWTKCYSQLDRDKKMHLLCKLFPFHVWVI